MTPPRIIGTLRRGADGRGVVRVEDVYDTSPGDLWSALTEPARLARWVAVVSGDLRRGAASKRSSQVDGRGLVGSTSVIHPSGSC